MGFTDESLFGPPRLGKFGITLYEFAREDVTQNSSLNNVAQRSNFDGNSRSCINARSDMPNSNILMGRPSDFVVLYDI